MIRGDWQLVTADVAYHPLGYRTRRALLEAARRGMVPCVRIGRRVRFDLVHLRERWAAQGGTSLTPATADETASARAEAQQ